MKIYHLSCIIGFMVILLGLIGITGTGIDADEINPGVAPVEEKHYGLTYGEWAIKWWQWALESPKNENPLTETTGDRCAIGQGGPVWFLGATWASDVNQITRNCTIPSGVGIFFPIYNGECSTAEYSEERSYADLRECVERTNNENSQIMTASVDGKALQQLQRYKIESPPFNLTLPENHVLGSAPVGRTPAYAIGWFVMLEPLSEGEHTVKFGTTATDLSYSADVTYNLEVK